MSRPTSYMDHPSGNEANFPWSAWNGAWLRGGSEVGIISDESGAPALVTFNAEGHLPPRTVPLGEWHLVTFAPVGDSIVLMVDRGGNEGIQLLKYDEDLPQLLTPDAGETNLFYGAAFDDGRIAYSSNRLSPSSMEIVVQGLCDNDPHVFAIGEGFFTVRDACSATNVLLVSERLSNVHNRLHLLDVSTESFGVVTTEEAHYAGAVFAGNGARIICRTDLRSEYMRLAVYDIELCSWSFLTEDSFDVDCFDVGSCAGGEELTYSANILGESVLHQVRLDNPAENLPLPAYPKGVISSIHSDPQSRRLLVSVSGPNTSPSIWRLGRSGEVDRLSGAESAGELGSIDCSQFTLTSFDGLPISALLYSTSVRSRSAVILVHGGPEDQARPHFDPMIRSLVFAGFDVICPNVRGSTGYGRSFTSLDDGGQRWGAFRDVRAIADVARLQFGYARLAVAGGSYGGYVAVSMMMFYPGVFDAAVSIVGMTNLVTFLEGTAPQRRAIREAEYGSLERDKESLSALSPIHEAKRLAAPLLLIHGRNDSRVPVHEAMQLIEAVDTATLVDMVIYEDEGHGLSHRSNQIDAYGRMCAFFTQTLNRY